MALAERGIKGIRKRFVFVPVQRKLQARPRGREDAPIKVTGVVVIPFRGSNL